MDERVQKAYTLSALPSGSDIGVGEMAALYFVTRKDQENSEIAYLDGKREAQATVNIRQEHVLKQTGESWRTNNHTRFMQLLKMPTSTLDPPTYDIFAHYFHYYIHTFYPRFATFSSCLSDVFPSSLIYPSPYPPSPSSPLISLPLISLSRPIQPRHRRRMLASWAAPDLRHIAVRSTAAWLHVALGRGYYGDGVAAGGVCRYGVEAHYCSGRGTGFVRML